MVFYKKNRVSPLPYMTHEKVHIMPTILEDLPVSKATFSFRSNPTEKQWIYLYLPGNIDQYVASNQGLIQTMSDDFNQLFKPSKDVEKTSILSDKPPVKKGIPKEHFYNTEEDAFNAAKNHYPDHAFVILKLNISKKEMVLVADRVQGKAIAVYNLDLMEHVRSVKGFARKEPYRRDNLLLGTTYIRNQSSDGDPFVPEVIVAAPRIRR